MTVVARRASAEQVRPLRNQVLRRGPQTTVPAYDEDQRTIHVAAVDDATGAVVGCGSIFPAPCDATADSWQLRGMAVDPAWQGRGVGRTVLDTLVAAAREVGVPMLWAYGRVTALGFYSRLGWQPVSDVFAHGPDQLPHRRIELLLR